MSGPSFELGLVVLKVDRAVLGLDLASLQRLDPDLPEPHRSSLARSDLPAADSR
jgi:hypothetical protein